MWSTFYGGVAGQNLYGHGRINRRGSYGPVVTRGLSFYPKPSHIDIFELKENVQQFLTWFRLSGFFNDLDETTNTCVTLQILSKRSLSGHPQLRPCKVAF